MVAYLENEKDLIRSFLLFVIEVIPRVKNFHADALVKLASINDAKLLNTVSIEFLLEPNINQ